METFRRKGCYSQPNGLSRVTRQVQLWSRRAGGGWPGKEKWDTELLLGLRAKSLLSRLEHKIKNAYECVSCLCGVWVWGHDSKPRAPHPFKVCFPTNGLKGLRKPALKQHLLRPARQLGTEGNLLPGMGQTGWKRKPNSCELS